MSSTNAQAGEGEQVPIGAPQQEEMPFAFVHGEAVTELPKDLYIPPDALEVFLEAFEGPLDLLLYLIRRQNLNVLNIPIAEITRQYMTYIDLMQDVRFDLAAEYLVMAAMLAEIKSRMLLPRRKDVEEEDDPRAELVRRLQEYERYKQAAESLDDLPRSGRDFFRVAVDAVDIPPTRVHPEVSMEELMRALHAVLRRTEMSAHHQVRLEPLSVRDRMVSILSMLVADVYMEFSEFFTPEEGKRGVVVTFLAILELARDSLIELVQTAPFEPIHVRVAEASEDAAGEMAQEREFDDELPMDVEPS
ncbi:MAG: segregation and condensation protein A [Gammaproteobacteria bacterium]